MSEMQTYDAKDAMLMKMGCERCELYVSSARAILYLYDDEELLKDNPRENLWHIIDMMSKEISILSESLAVTKE